MSLTGAVIMFLGIPAAVILMICLAFVERERVERWR
jgi:hypothetical protein